MTHGDLVERAVRWLAKSCGCQVIVTQKDVTASEEPDAIGWKASGASYLIECKVSRADFLRDAKKLPRQFPTFGLGNCRYYLTPPGMIGVEELPAGWGLLECSPRGLRKKREAVWQPEKNRDGELRLLLAQIRR